MIMEVTQLPTLYSRTSTGAVQSWQIEIGDGCYRTFHGQVGGKITVTEWTSVIQTNVGRANQRNLKEQALFEAKATWKKKKDAGAFEDIADIDTFTFVEPMLAKKWEDVEKKISFPVYCQPKLDGARCIITRHGATSRNGKPWITIPHILKALEPIFDQHPDLILDGELYCDKLANDFNKIMSLVKKTKPTQADLEESASLIQYHWYDIADTTNNFLERTVKISSLCNSNDFGQTTVVVPVMTFAVNDKEALDNLYENFLDEGYEGQMVRTNAPYEFKRSSTLLKRKEFQDDEYEVISIEEGNGNKSGMAGYAVLKREDGVMFRSNIKGNHGYLKGLLLSKSDYIGRFATCKYFNLTPDGIPRFPYVIGFRDGKGID
jgi:DNA ligase-1